MMQIPSFSGTSILVVGDVMLDRYWTGAAQRISPEAPVPVVRITTSEDRLGGAGNVAANLASLGCHTTLAGVIGEDEAGKAVLRLIESLGIRHSLVSRGDRPTITKLRVLARHQQLLRMDFEQPGKREETDQLLSAAEASLQQAQVLVLSDYAKGSLQGCARLVRKALSLDIIVVVDPKGNDWSPYQGATLVTPNLSELQLIAGPCQSDEEIRLRAQETRARFDFQALLVTLSEKGMLLVSRDQEPLHIAAQARDVFDVTGAGDTVVALLAASLAAGVSLPDATRLANLAAGIVVGKLGAASVTSEELARELQQQSAMINHGGIVDDEQLLNEVSSARQRGERIVMTNGCFDILHPGHIRYLQSAAELGDRLIVAVNTDRSVSALKGTDRPVNNLQDRMAMLAALTCVDWVVAFDEDTPANLIGQVLPDLLVKGGDYQPEAIAGYQAVVAAGGEVRVLPFEAGYSTSSLIKRIRAPG